MIETNESKIPLKMHPRVFAALGADLVTNDIVAVIELVKNSYDAFASEVRVSFLRHEGSLFPYLEIKDNGLGMTKEVIDEVWCTVATPYKETHPFVKNGDKIRRVSGAKGLGRLAVARLGKSLRMITKASETESWEVNVNWNDIASADSVSACYVSRREYKGSLAPEGWQGTILQINDLNGNWTTTEYGDLKENLARLLSPFESKEEFRIFVKELNTSDSNVVEIVSPKFLDEPKYKIYGSVDKNGQVSWHYVFQPIDKRPGRTTSGDIAWEQIQMAASEEKDQQLPGEMHSGPFKFEIRAWDIGADDILEVASNFKIQKKSIRSAIRSHKGLSVYRDNILVLPKSDNAKDWLGLDLRRVSKVGDRLSTSQIVGHISISADENPKLMDTSDRERLAINDEYKQFSLILRSIISILENERSQDRITTEPEKPMEELFSKLSAEDLLNEVMSIADEGGTLEDTMPVLRAFSKKIEDVKATLQQRMIYYSRLATVGTIAQMLVHEIRNCTTVIAYFMKLLMPKIRNDFPEDVERYYRKSETSVDRLEHLSSIFLPLANRMFNSKKRNCNLSQQVSDCFELVSKDIERLNIQTETFFQEDITLSVDPAEFSSILINLLTNAVYWLAQVPADSRKIVIRCTLLGSSRCLISVDDTGPGIPDDYVEKILWPGVTRKPNGIGMGLTVAAELVAGCDGKLAIKHPGALGGASLCFDLPIVTKQL
jgi:histidine kinase